MKVGVGCFGVVLVDFVDCILMCCRVCFCYGLDSFLWVVLRIGEVSVNVV